MKKKIDPMTGSDEQMKTSRPRKGKPPTSTQNGGSTQSKRKKRSNTNATSRTTGKKVSRRPKKSVQKVDPSPPKQSSKSSTFTSLLPPDKPRKSSRRQRQQVTQTESTVPFWDQFLDPIELAEQSDQQLGRTKANNTTLPTIEELFPSVLSSNGATTKVTATSDSSGGTDLYPPSIDGVVPVAELFYRSTADTMATDSNTSTITANTPDDEELPFSTQESDAVSTTARGSKSNDRRIVRRGMEMLVGGVPIHADPPMRSIHLQYHPPSNATWDTAISTNSPAFGPMLHVPSQLTPTERGLFCEYFRHYTHKWNVCPEELLEVVVDGAQQEPPRTGGSDIQRKGKESSAGTPSYEMTERDDVFDIEGEFSMEIAIPHNDFVSCEEHTGDESFPIFRSVLAVAFRRVLTNAVTASSSRTSRLQDTADDDDDDDDEFRIEIPTLAVVESSITKGYSNLQAVVKVAAGFDAPGTKLYRRVKKISRAFVKAMDEDDIAVAIAEAARTETRWPPELRKRLAEDCLFSDVGEDPDEEGEPFLLIPEPPSLITDTTTLGSLLEGADPAVGTVDGKRQRELFRGSGNDGAYHDYSEANTMNAPYQGQLGLRLVDAAVERAKMRHPRVIAVGDVHGCIDELQELLRLCDYSPGDIVVFLGDLVCKGPDSLSVVQMAREIGAIGVRGNHDFEVIRMHQAILAGIDRPVFGSEHFYIATCLSKADLKWLYSLPWFVSSKSLDALFVHAGFVAGIRLSKQNPRLMLNMR